jgi:predicted amidohydrolase
MKIAAAQIHLYPEVDQNIQNIKSWSRKAHDQGVDLVCFPEAALTGYLFEGFHRIGEAEINQAIDELGAFGKSLGINLVVGTPYRSKDRLFNSVAILLLDGRRLFYHKAHLVSFEKDYFTAGSEPLTFDLNNLTFGTIVCRDQSHPLLAKDLKEMGADVILISCAHYYRINEARLKIDKNRALPIARASENSLFVLKANAVGSSRGLIDLGHSMIVGPNGVVIAEAGETEEQLLTFDIDETSLEWGW